MRALFAAFALAVASAAAAQPQVDLVLIDGTVITVDGRNTVAQAIAIGGGLVVAVGTSAEIRARAGAGARVIDLAGKSVMPTLISTHVHPGFQKGTTYVAANFTRETVMNDLNRALYFGISVVQSQGIERGDVLYRIRADQAAGTLGGAKLLVAGRGIGAPNAGPGCGRVCRHRVRDHHRGRGAAGRGGARRERSRHRQDLGRRPQRTRAAVEPRAVRRGDRRGAPTRSARECARVLSRRRRGIGRSGHRWPGASRSRRRDERRADCRDRSSATST